MALDVHRKFLFEPNPHAWDRDFAETARRGVNFVRTGLCTAWSRAMLDPGAVDESVLSASSAERTLSSTAPGSSIARDQAVQRPVRTKLTPRARHLREVAVPGVRVRLEEELAMDVRGHVGRAHDRHHLPVLPKPVARHGEPRARS